MSFEESSELPSEPTLPTKPTTSLVSEMLTSSEIEYLRRVQLEQHAYAYKAFAHHRLEPLPSEHESPPADAVFAGMVRREPLMRHQYLTLSYPDGIPEPLPAELKAEIPEGLE